MYFTSPFRGHSDFHGCEFPKENYFFKLVTLQEALGINFFQHISCAYVKKGYLCTVENLMKFTVKNGTATTPGIFLGSKLFILKLVKFES